ncbi:MAG: DUF5011 domain-containing protein [Coriobacteriia bacterium]|nr:DUF5011 domain-containing protein [Coriobacteriia bacterium]
MSNTGGSDITDQVVHSGTVNTARKGLYTVTYQVENSAGNITTVHRVVVVNDGSYIVVPETSTDPAYILHAQSFIKRLAQANASTILDDSRAQAWIVNPSATNGRIAVASEVVSNSGYMAGCAVGIYDITIGIEGTGVTQNIKAVVVNKNTLVDSEDPDTATRYTIGANNITIRTSQVDALAGMGDAAKAALIETCAAEAWKLTDTVTPVDVVVTANGITAGATTGDSFEVTFAIKDVPTVTLTVTCYVYGTEPTIAFTERPLVFEQTLTSTPITVDELKSQMTVWDEEDGDLIHRTTYTIAGGITSLNRRNVGVWRVTYSVTDSDGNTVSATRAVVVTDGRYIIDEGDGVGGIIIGARDFVIQRSVVDGSEGQARSYSYAEAYDIDGNPLSGLTWTGQPAGYVSNAVQGSYPITWQVPGHAVTKTVNANVTDADVIDPGTKDSNYALVASNFHVNLLDAAAIVAGAPSSYIESAGVTVFKLVPSAIDRSPVLTNSAGFRAELGSYSPIVFAINGIAQSDMSVSVTGTVSQGQMPWFVYTTPLEVWVGPLSLQPAGSILADEYADLYQVAAFDIEDGEAGTSLLDGSMITVTYLEPGGVDTTQVGRYRLQFSVTDSDNNTATVSRVVVVNDGRYIVGESRILTARSFVTLLADVASSATARNAEILSKSAAALYNGESGDSISSTEISVFDNGGYSAAVDIYDIVIHGVDTPSSYISRSIQAEVVDADILESLPVSETEDTYYVFGNNIVLRPSEAELIIGAADPDTALLLALGAGARRSLPDGSLLALTPVITSDGGFCATPGVYTVIISDPNRVCHAVLSVTVGEGLFPVISAFPTPLNITWEPDSATYVSRAQIMTGVTAREIGASPETITSLVKINPDSAGVEQLPVIPLSVASVTPVTYTVTGSDGNTVSVTRALIVNDGSITFDENFILRARSFVIRSGDVVGSIDTLILVNSDSRAWRANGAPATAYVVDNVSMGSVAADYRPIIGIQEYSSLTRIITAKVLPNGTEGGNGDTYAITAQHFRINLTDARALQGAGSANYAAEFLSRANVTSYLRADINLSLGGTAELVDDSGFRTAVFAEEGTLGYPTVIPVRFWVSEDHDAFVWVDVTVSNGNHPVINAPAVRVIWVGDPAGKPDGMYLPAEWNAMLGVTAWDAEDLDITSSVKVGSISGGGVGGSGAAFVEGDPIDLGLLRVFQPISYQVTDSDYNTVQKTVEVWVTNSGVIIGDYLVDALSFVETVDNVRANGTSDGVILALSLAQAWRIKSTDPTEILPVSADHLLYVLDSGGYKAAVGDYVVAITVMPEAGYTNDNRSLSVIGKVIDRDVIDDTYHNGERYIIAANHVAITWQEAAQLSGSLSAVAQEILKEKAFAVAYLVADNADPVSHPVTVTANNIVQAAGSYGVTFTPVGVSGLSITVQFTVLQGDPVCLLISGALEFDQTNYSQKLSRNELMQGVTVIDPKTPAAQIADVRLTDAAGNAVNIDKVAIGVYQVIYSIEDKVITVDDGNGNQVPLMVSASRAVVVNDGRFIVDTENEVIIGAKDFVVSVKDTTFTGSFDDVLTRSFAEAYDFAGNGLNIELVGTLPPGFANREVGVYNFTICPVGYSDVTYTFKGEVVNADVLDPGGYDDHYALLASHFTVDVEQAKAMTGDAALIAAAGARVVKLVPKAADASVRVDSNGGFTSQKGVYPIRFGIAVMPAGPAGSVAPADSRTITVNGTVTDASAPQLSVRTPFEIAVGDPWNRDTAMTDVVAIDPGDGDITDSVIYYPSQTATGPSTEVDTTKPGIYQVTYEVTDSDGNSSFAERCVVVNDGRYVVGDGRILEARSFVIASSDVERNANQIKPQLLNMTHAKAYDGASSEELPQSMLSVPSTGGYSRSVGEYSVVISVRDLPSGVIAKTVKAAVVDADVIDDKPASSDDPSGTRVYVYGKNITLRISEAQAITDEALLLQSLGAHALIADPTDPAGALTAQAVIVLDNGGFTAAQGVYSVKVADIESICEIVLTVTVVEGSAPVLTPERPVVVPVAPHGGNLSNNQKKGDATAWDEEDGDLTSKIIVTGNVPANIPGIYQVTLSVTDSDGNTVAALVAVVVDDGSFVYGEEYILSAKDFQIDAADVDTSNRAAQITDQSRAIAARNDGSPASVSVSNLDGYTNVGGSYRPTISVSLEPLTARQITATVIPPGWLYRVTFNANGGTLTGPSAVYVQSPANTLSYLPSSPVRAGYSFRYWSLYPQGEAQFTPDFKLTGDITVYAQWDQNPAPPAPPEPPAPPVINVYPPPSPPPIVNVYPGGTTNITNNQPPTEVLVTIETTTSSGTEIDNPEVPLISVRAEPHWALFNVGVVVFSLLLVLVFTLRFIADMRATYEDEDSYELPRDKSFYVNAPVLLIIAAAFVEGLIVLLLTSDFSARMLLTDQYSIPLSLIVFVQLLTPAVAATLRNNSNYAKRNRNRVTNAG